MEPTASDRNHKPERAIILSAGQGRRLFPLTSSIPKCLLPVGEQSLLEWQLDQLAACGFREAVTVVGFGEAEVRKALPRRRGALEVRMLSNPLFRTSDNLVSCWVAREEMTGNFLLLNGDTIFEAAILERILASEPAPVTIAIDHKPSYDADDMKVRCEGTRLLDVGKNLPAERTDGEAIGMSLFRNEGPRLFRGLLDAAVEVPGAERCWYLSVIDRMASLGLVRTVSIDLLEWAEVDFPRDLERAAEVVAGWVKTQSGWRSREPGIARRLPLRVNGNGGSRHVATRESASLQLPGDTS